MYSNRNAHVFISVCLLVAGLACLAQADLLTSHAGKHHEGIVLSNVEVVDTPAEAYHITSNSFTYSFNLTASPNPGLVCVLLRADTTNDTTTGVALTWNSVTVPILVTETRQGVDPLQSAFVFGLYNPASGAQTASFTATNTATDNFFDCISLKNVNQTSQGAAFPNTAVYGPAGAVNPWQTSLTSANGRVAVAVMSLNIVADLLGTPMFTDSANGSVLNTAATYISSTTTSTLVGTSANHSGFLAAADVSN